jgi:hypothetical protein
VYPHRVLRSFVLAVLASAALAAQTPTSITTNIPFVDARPILDALHDGLPADLRSRTLKELEPVWPAWVRRRDAAIRARLEQGDEDSVYNMLLFGTTFTREPRELNDSARIGGRERAAEILRGRISDLVAGIASPGSNERLQFARRLVERRGIDPTTAAGKEQVRRYLLETMRRVVGEVDGYIRTLRSAKSIANPDAEFVARSRLFRDRGLSSDTSLLADFAVERALAALAGSGTIGVLGVRRVAVVGPGLDFTDKAVGYDFYPQQTIQPFSVIDSLVRLGLAKPDQLQVTAFDVSPRIIDHLDTARRRARAGEGYVLQLPRDADAGWTQDLVAYWKRFGDQIGAETKAVAAPPGAGNVELRAVRVRPASVLAIVPENLNIVLQRLGTLAGDERFDLVIASNIFVYYDAFEQSLAVANVASMLRPGGLLLSNNIVPELTTTPIRSIGATTVVYSDRPDDSDRVVWYRRQ